VIPVVAGSNPVGHPNLPPRAPRRWRAPALRDATPQAAFHAVALAALAQIEGNARGVLLSDDPEFLHQLRVGMRRLRAALRAFRGILVRKEARRVIRALRKLSPRLGAARDWDVLAARLAADRHSPGLLRKAQARQAAARRAARRALVSRRFASIGPRVRTLGTTASSAPLAQFGAAALTRAHRKLMAQADGPDWADAAARHAIRIRVKRLRYSCEFFAPAFPAKRVSTYLAALKGLQDILGALNDISVGRRLVGFDADEAVLVSRLGAAWTRFARRPVFWRASA
jgi:CHAD domain-containing protein